VIRTPFARPYRVMQTIAVGLLLGLVVSCGGSTSTSSPSAAGDGSTASSVTTDASDSGSGGNGSGDGSGNGGDNGGGGGNSGGGGSSDRGVAWAPFGPQDPTYPTPTWPVYNAFASGNCSKLAGALPSNDVGDYGKLMLAVCQAAVEGQTDKWATAESLAGADSSALGNDCVAPLVQEAVERALTWHQDHPDLSPKVQLQQTGTQTACGAEAASENAGENGDSDATDSSDTSDTSSDTSSDSSGTTDSPSGDASATP
jgi:hypothetical protein